MLRTKKSHGLSHSVAKRLSHSIGNRCEANRGDQPSQSQLILGPSLQSNRRQTEKSSFVGKKLIAALTLTLFFESGAQATVFTASGACVINGAWTQMALNQTAEIRNKTLEFQSDPNCKGITTLAADIDMAGQFVKDGQDPKLASTSELIETNPGKSAALQSALANQPDDPKLVRTLGHTFLQSVLGQVNSGTPAQYAMLAARASRATSLGLDYMTMAMDTIPNLQQCFIGHPDTAIGLLSAAVQVTGAFVSSGQGVSSHLANSILKVMTMLQQDKFAKIMRHLDYRNFQQAVSCLLETTTGAYCSAVDGMQLWKINQKYEKEQSKILHEVKANGKGQNVHVDGGVLEGYFIMTREIPVISDWLQRVMFGFHPVLKKDAEMKNDVQNALNNLYTMINTLEAAYNEGSRTLNSAPDLISKKNQAFKMLSDLVMTVAPEIGGTPVALTGPMPLNFFTQGTMPEFVPFFLIGMNEIPPPCRVQEDGRIVQTWTDWIKNGGKYRPEFDNPAVLVQKMWERLTEMTNKAKANGSAYLADRLVVDMQDLVTRALTSPNITVYDSFIHIYDYLESLKNRIKTQKGGDLRIISHIVATQSKLGYVITSFDDLKKLIPDPKDPKAEEKLDSGVIQTAFEEVVKSVYEHFNIVQQRDTFLATEMATFLAHDYSMKVHQGDQLNSYQTNLLLTSGKDLWDRVMAANSLNAADAYSDLTNALDINKNNIEAVEMLMGDALVPLVEIQRLRAERTRAQIEAEKSGKPAVNPIDDKNIQDAQASRWWKDRIVCANPFAKDRGDRCQYAFNHDLYPSVRWTSFGNLIHGTTRNASNALTKSEGDLAFGTTDQILARLCIQTLAFNNRDRYFPYCKDTVLKAPYSESDPSANLPRTISYNDLYYKRGTDKRVAQICAIRDYSRNNYVYALEKEFELRETSSAVNPSADGQSKPRTFLRLKNEAQEALKKHSAPINKDANPAPMNSDSSSGSGSGASGGSRPRPNGRPANPVPPTPPSEGSLPE